MSRNALDRVKATIVTMMAKRDPLARLAATTEQEHYTALGFSRSGSKDVQIVFVLRESVKPIVAVLRLLKAVAEKNKSTHNVVVSKMKPTYSASNLLKDTHMEHFVYTELLFPVVDHCLVPPHRLMDDREADAKLSELGVRRDQLPRLRKSDPVARFYNFPEGAMIEIHRCNGLQQRSLFYRLVSAGQ